MENALLDKPSEKLQQTKFDSNPFIWEGVIEKTVDNKLITVDRYIVWLPILRLLTRNGLEVFSVIPETFFKSDHSCRILTKTVCERLYGEYNEAFATRIRRGLRDLVANKVLAKSDTKDIYWVNKSIIWVQ